MFVSKDYVVDIETFMILYVGKIYDGKNKLTHNEMVSYVKEKNLCFLKRLSFKEIKTEHILNGTVIMVKDKTHKIVGYTNPLRIINSHMLYELTQEKEQKKAARIRRDYLKSKGLIETDGEPIKEEDLEKNQDRYLDNRTKKLINRDGYRMRRAI